MEKVLVVSFNDEEIGWDVAAAKLGLGGDIFSCLELEAG
jgi:hypothetical protein